MGTDTKKSVLQESGRWLRAGSLSLSVLGPFLSYIVSRLRAQAEADEVLLRLQEEHTSPADTQRLQEDLQHRLQSLRSNLNEVLAALRTQPTNQELLRRSAVLSEEIREQGVRLSRILSERGTKFSHDLRTHGNNISRSLRERGDDLSYELFKNTRRAQIERMQQRRNFWVAFGFGLGLTGAGIITYVLIQKRQHAQLLAENEAALRIKQEQQALNETIRPPKLDPNTRYTVKPGGDGTPTTSTGIATSKTKISPVVNGAGPVEPQPTSTVPADAAFIGITSTKHYYPINTPIENITDSVDKDAAPTDVIYFTTEKEAQLQGFSAAQA